MRIAITSAGSRGDVQPMAALAIALAARGHDVRLITHAQMSGLVEGSPVDFRALSSNIHEILASASGRRMILSGRNVLQTLRAGREITQTWLPRWGKEIGELASGVDVLVAELTTSALSMSWAEAWNIPCIQVRLQPAWWTREFPSPCIPARSSSPPRTLNYFHHGMVAEGLWHANRSILNRFRRDIVGVEPWPFWFGLSKQLQRQRWPVLMAFSPVVVPRPDDWEARIVQTGYWFLEHDASWNAPAELLDFLGAGPAPVYIGFGSMSVAEARAHAAIALEAIRWAGCRAVISTGSDALSQQDLTSNTMRIDAVPHDWLFPKMAAVVHHAGAGTTAAALRAGMPSIPVPFMADQYFWADRLQKLGVAASIMPRKDLSARKLAAAIDTALSSDSLRAAASTLGGKIRAEQGLKHAMEQIEAVAR